MNNLIIDETDYIGNADDRLYRIKAAEDFHIYDFADFNKSNDPISICKEIKKGTKGGYVSKSVINDIKDSWIDEYSIIYSGVKLQSSYIKESTLKGNLHINKSLISESNISGDCEIISSYVNFCKLHLSSTLIKTSQISHCDTLNISTDNTIKGDVSLYNFNLRNNIVFILPENKTVDLHNDFDRIDLSDICVYDPSDVLLCTFYEPQRKHIQKSFLLYKGTMYNITENQYSISYSDSCIEDHPGVLKTFKNPSDN